MSGIDWDQSWWMSAEQVITLGLEGISVLGLTAEVEEE